MNVEKIEDHLNKTNFVEWDDGVVPLKLWTYNNTGLFSDGSEGFNLSGICNKCEHDNVNIDNINDLEFIAKAPEYIKYLLNIIKNK